MRIFIGLGDFGDYVPCLAAGMRAHGADLTTVVIERKGTAWKHLNEHYDRVIRSPHRVVAAGNLVREAIRALPKYDIFIFVGARSFTSDFIYNKALQFLAFSDLRLLKWLGKKIVVTAHGSEIRSARMYLDWLRSVGLNSWKYGTDFSEESLIAGENYKHIRAEAINRHADVVFAQPQYAHLLTRPHNFLWLPIDLSALSYGISGRERPKILHAPSSRKHKGTRFVLNAISELEREGLDFDFELFEDVENPTVRRRLKDADIVVDQFEPAGIGLLGLEALGSGCALVSGIVPGCVFPEEFPAVSVTPYNLTDRLRSLVKSRELRVEMSARGRRYVEKYHDHVSVAGDFLRAIGAYPGGGAGRE